MSDLFQSVALRCGARLPNRFVLAPLTNQQSHADGVLSDAEFRWLSMRAEGGFGLTMTCAASVDAGGLGFPGQLGVHDDRHLPGLTRLAAAINEAGSHSVVQLHHAGMRSPKALVGTPVCPSADTETGARAMSLDEVRRTRDAFIAAAGRAERAGFAGVELHGAHGYLICQFLSALTNKRDDLYGGPEENRARLLLELIDGVRAATRPGFSLGLRLSPERFGLKVTEIASLAGQIMAGGKIDYLDMSLWDVFKEPEETEHKGRTLLSYFTDLPRHGVALGAAGKIQTAAQCREMLAAGLDFVVLGRSAILHHDFPDQVARDPNFVPAKLPVTAGYLEGEGLSPAFVGYMRNWKGFVAEAQ
jgi:2,4-dienoyl-CoA reductase-like NADH-dependent reductase (Old Yellow Enzyme family)